MVWAPPLNLTRVKDALATTRALAGKTDYAVHITHPKSAGKEVRFKALPIAMHV